MSTKRYEHIFFTISGEKVSSNTLYFTVPFTKPTLSYIGSLYKPENLVNVSLADTRDLPGNNFYAFYNHYVHV